MAKVKLKGVRLSYPELYTPVLFDKSVTTGTKRYKAAFLIEKSDKANYDLVMAAIVAEAKAKFGDKAKAMLTAFKADKQKYCFVDGDVAVNTKGELRGPGNYILSSSRAEKDGPPGVFDNKAGANGKPAIVTEASGRVYAGCYVNAVVDIWAQEGKYAGIRCSLSGVQFVKDGEAFGGSRPASADEFESLADEAEMASATTESGDDFGAF